MDRVGIVHGGMVNVFEESEMFVRDFENIENMILRFLKSQTFMMMKV